MTELPPNITITAAPIILLQAATEKELADLEDAVRDFGPRMARLRELGVPSSALLRTYRATCKMCGQTSLFDAVAALPPR